MRKFKTFFGQTLLMVAVMVIMEAFVFKDHALSDAKFWARTVFISTFISRCFMVIDHFKEK